MKRMTKKDLEEVKQAHHVGDTGYAKTVYIERLVNEVEACWRGSKNLKGQLKACRGKLTILRNKNEVGCNV